MIRPWGSDTNLLGSPRCAYTPHYRSVMYGGHHARRPSCIIAQSPYESQDSLLKPRVQVESFFWCHSPVFFHWENVCAVSDTCYRRSRRYGGTACTLHPPWRCHAALQANHVQTTRPCIRFGLLNPETSLEALKTQGLFYITQTLDMLELTDPGSPRPKVHP